MLTDLLSDPWYTETRPWRRRQRQQAMEESKELFFHLFRLLRISPSYEIARKLIAGELQDIPSEPKDLERVLLTFRMFGDVRCTRYKAFWKRCVDLYEKPHQDWFARGVKLPVPQEEQPAFLYRRARSTPDVYALKKRVQLLYEFYEADPNAGLRDLARKKMSAADKKKHPGLADPNFARYSHKTLGIIERDAGHSKVSGLSRELKIARQTAENAARGMFPTDKLSDTYSVGKEPYDYFQAVVWHAGEIRERIMAMRAWDTSQAFSISDPLV